MQSTAQGTYCILTFAARQHTKKPLRSANHNMAPLLRRAILLSHVDNHLSVSCPAYGSFHKDAHIQPSLEYHSAYVCLLSQKHEPRRYSTILLIGIFCSYSTSSRMDYKIYQVTKNLDPDFTLPQEACCPSDTLRSIQSSFG